MTQDTKQLTAFVVGAALLLFVGINVMLFMFGVGDGIYYKSKCDPPHRRIVYTIPGYLAGCWLADFPESTKQHN